MGTNHDKHADDEIEECIEECKKSKQKHIDRIAWKAESKQIYNKTNKGKA